VSKRARLSTSEDSSWSSGHHSETLVGDQYPFFESAWEERLSAESSNSSLGISPDALWTGHDESVGFIPTPKRKWDCSSSSPLEYAAIEPGQDSAVDVNVASDYGFGTDNHSFLFISDAPNMAINATPSDDITFLLEQQDFVSFDIIDWVLPQLSFSSTSSPVMQSHDAGASCTPSLDDSSTDWCQPRNQSPSRVPLPRLPRLECPQCQEQFADRRQLSRHSREHKTVACDVDGCPVVLKDKRSLERHKKSVHDDLFPGPISVCKCGFETTRKDNYLRHGETCEKRRKRKR